MATKNEMKELTVQEKRELTTEQATREGPHFEPSVDIWENDLSLTLVADVPGASAGDFEIDVRENVLTLTAKVSPPDARWKPIYEEYRVGNYMRQFRVGQQVDQSKISAKIKDGVLTLALPKAESAMPRKIRVATVE